MKASLKFRDDEQKPIFRAKVPINILGLPFQSGIVAGESKELALNLSTFFESGPVFKFAYRPNDAVNPFSFVFKTGIGHFGSPIESSINMSAEFNLVGGQNPSFFVKFNPKFGDFALKKSRSSVVKSETKGNGVVSAIDDGPVIVEAEEFGKRFTVLPLETAPAVGVVKSALSDVVVSARTTVPVLNHAVLSFRWGVKFLAPLSERKSRTAGMFDNFPLLVMNKVGIEHMVGDNAKDKSKDVVAATNDVAGACMDVKRQLEVMQAENGMLRNAMEELKVEFFAGNKRGEERADLKSCYKRSSEMSRFAGKGVEGDVKKDEELKRGSKGTPGA